MVNFKSTAIESSGRFLKRYAAWLIPGITAIVMLNPGTAEFRTLFLVVATECLAVFLSGLALLAYTQLDFTKEENRIPIGHIFMGVHLCTGLTVLGVYIAQLS
ncbi:MAG: hypothetical protein ACLFR2_03420 [Candidatus Kapaibacterium sp.]